MRATSTQLTPARQNGPLSYACKGTRNTRPHLAFATRNTAETRGSHTSFGRKYVEAPACGSWRTGEFTLNIGLGCALSLVGIGVHVALSLVRIITLHRELDS